MPENTERFLTLFNQLQEEDQKNFLLALEFSVASQKNVLKQIQQQHPEYELNLEPALTEVTQAVAING